MKRILCFGLAATLFVLFLHACCKKAPMPDEWKDLKDVADSFSLEDAKNDGYVVIEDSVVTSGADVWQSFVGLSAKKTPCKVRIVRYYTLDNSSRYDPEYFESIKGDYPKMYIFELVYNGKTYSVSHYEEDDLYQAEFKHLVKYEGLAENPNATFTSYIRYVLVDDDKVTWEDIIWGMLSSYSDDFIQHRQIYTDLVFKEGYNE